MLLSSWGSPIVRARASARLQGRYGFPRTAAPDERGTRLGERLRLAERNAELAEHRSRLIQLLTCIVELEREVVGQREAAQRFRPLEDASVRRRQIECLPKQPQTLNAVARAVRVGRPSQQIIERATG